MTSHRASYSTSNSTRNTTTAGVVSGVDPAAAVEIYHLHCHFGGPGQRPGPGLEECALDLLESTKAAIRRLRHGGVPLHEHVWHEKNGPHDVWSWELWVEDQPTLGVAVAHFMSATEQSKRGLHLLLHADTDQEYTDHAGRLCWVGAVDPVPLDLLFFSPPDETYQGPGAHTRETNAEAVFSMGEHWARNSIDGAVLNEGYGAIDRSSFDGTAQPTNGTRAGL
jgi:aromatic ring-cleaving dioxygenase